MGLKWPIAAVSLSMSRPYQGKGREGGTNAPGVALISVSQSCQIFNGSLAGILVAGMNRVPLRPKNQNQKTASSSKTNGHPSVVK